MAKALDQNGSDCEGRKLGEQNGLDTPFAKTCTKCIRCGMFALRNPIERFFVFADKEILQ